MTIEEFRDSVGSEVPPNVSPPLLGLWYDAKGDWSAAHETVQADSSADAAWVHAYLHRKEGDISNAGYWYRRAGKTAPAQPLEKEWETIVDVLLGND